MRRLRTQATTSISAACSPTVLTRCWRSASSSTQCRSPTPSRHCRSTPRTCAWCSQNEDSDDAGLDAMTPLIPAVPSAGVTDGVHWLLPLPPGIAPDALELFGFWTYEFRVGHNVQWSTAQGRFGRPLRVAGLQHPPPRLVCTV